MGKQHPTVQISPDVLRWAMEGSGWNARELSEKTKIKPESILIWEKQTSAIKVSDLRNISKTIKRPLSTLLLPEPPEEKKLTDYRKIRGADTVNMSKKTLAVIRKARYLQSSVGELLELRSEDAQPKITHRTLGDDPEIVAEVERGVLGLALEKRRKGEGINTFVQTEYLNLKEKMESFNIFVMQAAIDITEARGFTLSEGYPKVILINSRDDPRSRLFTLLHEYAHLLLKTDGICLTNLHDFQGRPEMQVERWCNNFAGAAIMPKDMILNELHDMANRSPNRIIDSISSKFCTSKMAAVVRILNLLGRDQHRGAYLEYYKTISSKPAPKTGGGGNSDGRDMAKECINHNGIRYVRLVSDSRNQGLITTNGMSRYLDLKTKYFERLNELI